MSIVLTDFARPRLFPREPRGNTIQDITPEQFERHLNDVSPLRVLDGYAPFCKLHVHGNWTSNALPGSVRLWAKEHLRSPSGLPERTGAMACREGIPRPA